MLKNAEKNIQQQQQQNMWKGYTIGITWMLTTIANVKPKEKLRYIEISSRKMQLSAVILYLT